MKNLTYRFICLYFVPIVALWGCVNESDSSRIKPGDRIPSFTVTGPYGNFSSTEFTGKGGLLVLFASYCSTCQSVLPQIELLWEASWDGELFALAALSRQGVYDETEDSVGDYWESNGYAMPYYLDYKGEVYYQFAKETIPRIYVVDKQGYVTFLSLGDGSITAGELAAELENALDIEIDL
ncbi:MAG: TlpA family protein disulfide reductase [Alistipes sp.]|nr:TlpA family protein disulfide reductase [Alistipes sp.]